MDKIEINLIWSIVLFLLLFLVNYFLVFKNGYNNIKKQKKKKKNKKIEDFIGLSYLIPKFNLDVNKLNLNYVFIMVSLMDAFIISVVFFVIISISWDIGFSLLLGFVLLFGLIYSLYELFGRSLVKKGWSKNA